MTLISSHIRPGIFRNIGFRQKGAIYSAVRHKFHPVVSEVAEETKIDDLEGPLQDPKYGEFKSWKELLDERKGQLKEGYESIIRVPGAYHKEPHPLPLAIKVLRSFAISTGRNETLKAQFKLNVEKKREELIKFNGSVLYDRIWWEPKRVVVFATDELDIAQAMDAGAVAAGADEELRQKISNGQIEYDTIIATNEGARVMKGLQKVLKANFPSLKRGTVVTDVSSSVRDIGKGVLIRANNQGVITAKVAKVFWSFEDIERAFSQLFHTINSMAEKSNAIAKIDLSTTQGPSVPLDFAYLKEAGGLQRKASQKNQGDVASGYTFEEHVVTWHNPQKKGYKPLQTE
eukprot:Clim_evm40s109 gene=Clim_evmTU40s109